MSRLMKLDGTYWRVPSGYVHNSDVTAMDVLIFDREELGNEDTRWFTQKIDLNNISANECTWFCADKSKADKYSLRNQYGDVLVAPQPFILQDAVLLGTDGMYGFFIYTPNRKIQG